MAQKGGSEWMATSPTRLRQIALVVEDLENAKHLLTTVLGTEVVYRDPLVEQWGLKNILVPLGGDIIEVVSPFKPNTTAGRLLSKRGDGGYMIIMQTEDARARRNYLESNTLAKVIFMHELEESVCIQYHPKGIKGGMIPELDSHTSSPTNLKPLSDPFSPWHACGPASTYPTYSATMKRHSNLHLLGARCRLSPGDSDVEGATQQWEDLFGVKRRRTKGESQFTNARLKFVPGQQGKAEGLVELLVSVEGKTSLNGVLDRAKALGLLQNDGSVEMIGIRWKFILSSEGWSSSRL